MSDELLSVPEVAERLKISPQTIYRWIDEGTLAAIRIGRQYRVKESTLERLMEDAAVGADGTGDWSGVPPRRPTVEE